MFAGVALLRGYGFVQFAREDDAIRAVAAENGSLLKGFIIGQYCVNFSICTL